MRAPLSQAVVSAFTSRLSALVDPSDAEGWLALLRLLFRIGREDLPLGRVIEGHVDALQLICRYGDTRQSGKARRHVREGAIFGVWNADDRDDPLRLAEGKLVGAKAFASGTGLVTHALVSVDLVSGRQLLLLDLARHPPAVDTGWWDATGMQRSQTHLVSWNGAVPPQDAHVGAPGDYVREPWFSGGALRFAAVQAGGIASVADGVRDHLIAEGRAGDPYQVGRLADLFGLAQGAADAVRLAGQRWRCDKTDITLANVAAARTAVYRAGEAALTLASAAVGVQAMFASHPLAQRMADLSTYLRQPGPDAQRARVGHAVADGLLSVEL